MKEKGKEIILPESVTEEFNNDVENIKASQTSRSHLIGAGANNRTFRSPEEMVAAAESIYATKNEDEINQDKVNGLDINDINSIINFKVGYTPSGNSLLVKFIKEETNYGKIILPDITNPNKKAVVIVAGLYVTNFKAGDIILLKGTSPSNPLPPHENRLFKNIKFKEISAEAAAGIFMDKNEWLDRIVKDNEKLKEAGL